MQVVDPWLVDEPGIAQIPGALPEVVALLQPAIAARIDASFHGRDWAYTSRSRVLAMSPSGLTSLFPAFMDHSNQAMIHRRSILHETALGPTPCHPAKFEMLAFGTSRRLLRFPYSIWLAVLDGYAPNHSFSFNQRRRPDTFLTAIATAFFWPTKTINRWPLSSETKCNTPADLISARLLRTSRSVAMPSYVHLSEDERDQIGVQHFAHLCPHADASLLSRQARDRVANSALLLRVAPSSTSN